jgi:Ca2+-binding RTX toxin-like protein
MKLLNQITIGLASAALLGAGPDARAAAYGNEISASMKRGVLTVTGTHEDDTIVVSRDVHGISLVNDGMVDIKGGVPTIAETSLIRIIGQQGDDELRLDETNGPLPPANLLGRAGDDLLVGGSNADRLEGEQGNDTLIGGPSDDEFMGGHGDDQFVWNPGDGSDVVEGDDGEDTLRFNGSSASEIFVLSAEGSRFRLVRNVGPVFMDCEGLEQVVCKTFGGADRVTVGNLADTQVTRVGIDLLSDSEMGDGEADTVIVEATSAADVITLAGSSAGVDVVGLSAAVTVIGGESGTDRLAIHALDGDDVVDAGAVQSGSINLVLDGGRGVDVLLGGQGDDLLAGASGDDLALCGPGDDTFQWDPGDGSDVVEGQAGFDTLLFNGANVGEIIDLSASGQRLRFFRNVANIVMDCDNLERVVFNALGGADAITINDLSGTDVVEVNLDLADASGVAPDGAADTIVAQGTEGNDVALVIGDAAGTTLVGLAASVNVFFSDPLLDRLVVNALSGDDIVESSSLAAGVIGLTVDGGAGADVLIGSDGDDVLFGGEGDDVLLGGQGIDQLDGGAGDNIVIQD